VYVCIEQKQEGPRWRSQEDVSAKITYV
jgi:hypothetical protein